MVITNHAKRILTVIFILASAAGIILAGVRSSNKVKIGYNTSLAAAAQEPLVGTNDIQYLGAFLLPSGTFGPSRFGYGGGAPAYYKDASGKETLFMQGHAWWPGNVAQVQVPQIINSANLSDLARATLLQPFSDITDGKLGGDDGDRLGSLAVYNGKLIVGSYVYYDGSGSQQRFVGTSGLDLSLPTDFSGFYAPTGINPGKLGRYTTPIPSEWQSLLGGPALSGACCISIISRSNFGPGVSVYNPADVTTKNPVPFKELLGYPADGQVHFGTDGSGCGAQSNVFNCATNIVGVAFPQNTRSVLFFGTQGTGPICYKDNGPASCQGTGGYNAPPYRSQIWAYDANDLAEVYNGTKQPSQIQPYGIFYPNFTLHSGAFFVGATFDPASNRVFLTEANGEETIVDVIKINTAATPTPPPPPPAPLPPPPPPPVPTPVPGDLNLDHIVNSIDWSIMNSKWFTTDAAADLNHDGIVNSIDYSILNANWFKTW